mgnify:CR=1 FL=1
MTGIQLNKQYLNFSQKTSRTMAGRINENKDKKGKE